MKKYVERLIEVCGVLGYACFVSLSCPRALQVLEAADNDEARQYIVAINSA